MAISRVSSILFLAMMVAFVAAQSPSSSPAPSHRIHEAPSPSPSVHESPSSSPTPSSAPSPSPNVHEPPSHSPRSSPAPSPTSPSSHASPSPSVSEPPSNGASTAAINRVGIAVAAAGLLAVVLAA